MSRSAPFAGLLLVAACAAPPTPLPPPPLERGVRAFAGSVISGPTSAEVDFDAGRAWVVRCTMLRVEDVEDIEGIAGSAAVPIAIRSRLVVAGEGDRPVSPTAKLAQGVRVVSRARDGESPPPGASRVFDLARALPPGATAEFSLRVLEPVEPAGPVEASADSERRPRLRILVEHEPGSGEPVVALAIDDPRAATPAAAPGAADALSIGPSPDREPVTRQLVLLEDAPAIDGDHLLLLIPPLGQAAGDTRFVARVTVDSGVSDALLAWSRDDLARTAQRAALAVTPILRAESDARALLAGLRSLQRGEASRATLAFLAGSTDASPLALDLVLAADDETLSELAAKLRAELGEATPEAAGPSPVDDERAARLPWLLERSAFEWLAAELERGDGSAAARGLLARHAGEFGLDGFALPELLAQVTSRAELNARLVEENLMLLEASSPASRVRAFDWLSDHGEAPPDFDPLAERKARSRVLTNYLDARAAR